MLVSKVFHNTYYFTNILVSSTTEAHGLSFFLLKSLTYYH